MRLNRLQSLRDKVDDELTPPGKGDDEKIAADPALEKLLPRMSDGDLTPQTLVITYAGRVIALGAVLFVLALLTLLSIDPARTISKGWTHWIVGLPLLLGGCWVGLALARSVYAQLPTKEGGTQDRKPFQRLKIALQQYGTARCIGRLIVAVPLIVLAIFVLTSDLPPVSYWVPLGIIGLSGAILVGTGTLAWNHPGSADRAKPRRAPVTLNPREKKKRRPAPLSARAQVVAMLLIAYGLMLLTNASFNGYALGKINSIDENSIRLQESNGETSQDLDWPDLQLDNVTRTLAKLIANQVIVEPESETTPGDGSTPPDGASTPNENALPGDGTPSGPVDSTITPPIDAITELIKTEIDSITTHPTVPRRVINLYVGTPSQNDTNALPEDNPSGKDDSTQAQSAGLFQYNVEIVSDRKVVNALIDQLYRHALKRLCENNVEFKPYLETINKGGEDASVFINGLIDTLIGDDDYKTKRDMQTPQRQEIVDKVNSYLVAIGAQTSVLSYPAPRFLQLINGPIQRATIFAFWFSVLVGARAWLGIPSLTKRLDHGIDQFHQDEFPGGQATPDEFAAHKEIVDTTLEYAYIYQAKITTQAAAEAFDHAPHLGRRAHEAYADVVDTAIRSGQLADIKYEAQAQRERILDDLDGDFTYLDYGVWLLPSIGFLGTIIGIGRALMQSRGMVTAPTERLDQATSLVTNELGVAFDTTLVALVLSIVLYLLRVCLEVLAKRSAGEIHDWIEDGFIDSVHFKPISSSPADAQ